MRPDKHFLKNVDEVIKKQRRLKKRRKYNREYNRKFKRTFSGMIRRMRDKIVQRCKRGDSKKPYLYKRKFVPTAKDFRAFAEKNRTLKRLYTQWKASGFKLKLRPTPDRINPRRGYHVKNIRFVTLSRNCQLAGKKKKRRRNKR